MGLPCREDVPVSVTPAMALHVHALGRPRSLCSPAVARSHVVALPPCAAGLADAAGAPQCLGGRGGRTSVLS